MSMNSIAVLTSGGDAPGMNAAVRAVARTAIANGIRVIGVRRGYNGLISGDVFEMNLRSVSDIIHRGGTTLFTARSPEFNTPAGVQKAADTCRDLGIGGVVVIGGDGSFRGARDLTNAGIPCVGIPGTIDNDIQCSEYTIGFDTAMNTAMEMVDIIDRMQFTQMTGKKHFIVVVAEGIGGVEQLAKDIEDKTGIESRATVLGHVQRGGSPTLRDRVVASEMGYKAVELLVQGKSNRVVAMRHGDIVDFDITEALQMKKQFNKELYDIALKISI